MCSGVHAESMTLQEQVVELRKQGKTYGEMRSILKQKIAKSTLSYWCRNVSLPPEYASRIAELNLTGLQKSRTYALIKKQEIQDEQQKHLINEYLPIKSLMKDKQIALIALSMLCLGEAAKGKNLLLGSSDPRIIRLFLGLLKKCFDFNIEKVRCTVQCRADQNIQELEDYWMNVTGIPKRFFYKARIDGRTIGKPTLHTEYRGVLKVNYFNSQIQKTLKVLYNLLAECV
jgi:hypothetical protein